MTKLHAQMMVNEYGISHDSDGQQPQADIPEPAGGRREKKPPCSAVNKRGNRI